MAVKGYFTFVLHAHLPWVLNHGVWPHGMSWLNEASAECYMQLLNELNALLEDGYTPHLTIGLTPVLCEMLINPRFKDGFIVYLQEHVDAANRDLDQFRSENLEVRAKMAQFWVDWYTKMKDLFVGRYNQDLIGAFKGLQDKDVIEILTCVATHGYTPLIPNDECIDAQFKTGVESYMRVFGRAPRGTWLPECAYRPAYKWKNPVDNSMPKDRKGVEYFVSKNHLEYFFVDTHLLMGGTTQGIYTDRFRMLGNLYKQYKANYKPVRTAVPRSPLNPYLVYSPDAITPVAFLTREETTGILVWSGEVGYPGDGNYLDFHKKHFPGGLRYWRVTGAKLDLGLKEEYVMENTPPRLDENASHYVSTVRKLLLDNYAATGQPGLVCSMYDAELFGHWWFEGTQWMGRVLRMIQDDPEMQLTTAGKYLDMVPPVDPIALPEGSWGQGGGHWVWLNEWTAWTWEKITECEKMVMEIADKYANAAKTDETLRSITSQLARELLILEASDWQFLISTWSARDYAEARVVLHYESVLKLYNMANAYAQGGDGAMSTGNWEFLGRMESEDGLFPEVDIGWWKHQRY
jgi:1,4-alpha-glucan branching enzyme